MSEPITLASALLKAQAGFEPIVKEADNPFYHSKYANLDAIVKACWPSLRNQGIWAHHQCTQSDGKLTVTFLLTLASTGETESNSLTVAEAATVQAIGSQITYLRRYTCVPALGITSEDDDDGNAASAAPAKKQQAKPKPAVVGPPIPLPPAPVTNLPPADWPETQVHDLKLWIGKLSTPADFRTAWEILHKEPTLVGVLSDWEPVLRQFAAKYKAHAKTVATPELTSQIKAALDTLAIDLAANQEPEEADLEAMVE